ncbi:MAG: carboxymuconolactone decarboxylase family protein [Rhodospirillaceae bacterium]|jgi:AhpD family alkylhydroperoxidase|nr:carboxymuconolactone decarboxylase family protein [Rhodospirillaceae bacterium]MBT5036274.1 carboxymuconolactone decarboxylase family protein [Rhodospirillaceae bacterium]MBT6218923.1 carboxymuconolactone decarboxylase family protein [Rhodospirillaceae bacterium]MBT6362870.1 carboxymuconolactone decarboxylase family protein [Rhodospirillaceae bacterium]
MPQRYPELANDLSESISRLRTGIPDTMKGFSMMASAATVDGALDPKTKELIAIAIGVAVRCDGCIAFHSKAAEKNGASREEFLDTLGMAVYMGGGPSMVYAAQALDAYDQFAELSKKRTK